MRCFINYQRDNADTINGEALIVSQRYSTFDKAEMDRFEDYLKSSISCGISVEYDIDKCIENEKGDNDAILDKIRAEIEQLTSRYSISKERGGMGQVEWSDRLIKESDVLQIIDKYKVENKE